MSIGIRVSCLYFVFLFSVCYLPLTVAPSCGDSVSRAEKTKRLQGSPPGGEMGDRLFSRGGRREDEADRSLWGVLSNTTGAFNRELSSLARVGYML